MASFFAWPLHLHGVMLLAFAVSPAGAQVIGQQPVLPGADPKLGELVVAQSLKLSPISADELITGAGGGGSRAFAEGTWSRGAPPPISQRINPRVVRRLNSVWRTRLPAGAPLDRLSVSYDVLGPDGSADRLAHESGRSSPIRVVVHPLAPSIVSQDRVAALVEGGVVLELDISAARNAGRYSGTLLVRVEDL